MDLSLQEIERMKAMGVNVDDPKELEETAKLIEKATIMPKVYPSDESCVICGSHTIITKIGTRVGDNLTTNHQCQKGHVFSILNGVDAPRILGVRRA